MILYIYIERERCIYVWLDKVLTNVNSSNGTKMRSGRQLGDTLHTVVVAPYINGQIILMFIHTSTNRIPIRKFVVGHDLPEAL